MAQFDTSNPMVVLEGLGPGDDHLLHVPGWPRLELVHATVDNCSPGGGGRACHRHVVFHAVVVTAGRGSFLLDDVAVAIDGPGLFLVSPDQPHSFQRCRGDDTVYSEVTFQAVDDSATGDWSQLLARWTGAPGTLPAWQPIPAPLAAGLRALISRVADPLLAARPQGAAIARGRLVQVLLEIWSELALGGAVVEDDPLERGRRFLEANAHRALTLDAFARELALSPKHAGRAFRQRFGQPPMQYHRACSLRRAAVLLRTTAHPLKQVAALSGFDDAHYFNRCFRRAYGVAPGAYRARYVRSA